MHAYTSIRLRRTCRNSQTLLPLLLALFVVAARGSAISVRDTAATLTSAAELPASSSSGDVDIVVITRYNHTTVPLAATLPWISSIYPDAACNWEYQFCNRTGFPYYNTDSNYNNPYDGSESECSSDFQSTMMLYFESAPVSSTDAVPGSVASGVADETITRDLGSVAVTSIATGTAVYGAFVNQESQSSYAESDLETISLVVVNAVGVMVTTLETLVRSIVTSTGYSVVWSEQFTTLTSGTDVVTPVAYASAFSYTPAAPCCSSCGLTGTDVQVFYWPSVTATIPSNISTMVNDAGFTL
jgi:hypothetical protein